MVAIITYYRQYDEQQTVQLIVIDIQSSITTNTATTAIARSQWSLGVYSMSRWLSDSNPPKYMKIDVNWMCVCALIAMQSISMKTNAVRAPWLICTKFWVSITTPSQRSGSGCSFGLEHVLESIFCANCSTHTRTQTVARAYKIVYVFEKWKTQKIKFRVQCVWAWATHSNRSNGEHTQCGMEWNGLNRNHKKENHFSQFEKKARNNHKTQ